MTLSDGTFWGELFLTVGESSTARSLLVALLAVFMSPSLAAWVARQSSRLRRVAFPAALAPLFAPELIVGYCYSSGSFSLVHLPAANTGLYLLLLMLKTVPIGMLVVLYAPASPVSLSAFHCHRLLHHRSGTSHSMEFWIRGPLYQYLPVFAISFLVVFQEFEIASLMSIPSWTVDVFDAQAKGIRPLATIRILIVPFATVSAIVLPAVAMLIRGHQFGRTGSGHHFASSRWFGGAFVLVANLMLWVIPVGAIAADGMRHATALTRNTAVVQGFVRELSSAMAFAFCGALAAVFFAQFLLGRWQSNESLRRNSLVVILLLPGLAGSLAVSLVIFLAIQHPSLISLRETPVPAVLGIAVFLLPRAVLMLLLFQFSQPGPGVGLASALSQSGDALQKASGFQLLWQLKGRAVFWTCSAVFFWGFFNLTTASLLVPLAIVPLPAQLYNLMHYGQTMSLSTQTLLSVVVPISLISLAAMCMPHVERMLSSRRP